MLCGHCLPLPWVQPWDVFQRIWISVQIHMSSVRKVHCIGRWSNEVKLVWRLKTIAWACNQAAVGAPWKCHSSLVTWYYTYIYIYIHIYVLGVTKNKIRFVIAGGLQFGPRGWVRIEPVFSLSLDKDFYRLLTSLFFRGLGLWTHLCQKHQFDFGVVPLSYFFYTIDLEVFPRVPFTVWVRFLLPHVRSAQPVFLQFL